MFNDLAKAFAYFEKEIQKNERNLANCRQDDQAELAEQNHHYIVAIATMRIVMAEPLTALRLQQLQEVQK